MVQLLFWDKRIPWKSCIELQRSIETYHGFICWGHIFLTAKRNQAVCRAVALMQHMKNNLVCSRALGSKTRGDFVLILFSTVRFWSIPNHRNSSGLSPKVEFKSSWSVSDLCFGSGQNYSANAKPYRLQALIINHFWTLMYNKAKLSSRSSCRKTSILGNQVHDQSYWIWSDVWIQTDHRLAVSFFFLI